MAAALFPRDGPDLTARSWGHHSSGTTFSAQSKLPKQPLPSLESSCQKYLEALRVLQSEHEQKASAKAVEDFLVSEGRTLQAQLQEYDKTHDNWFEHFCYEAFLGDDSPVVLNSNAFCAFKPDPTPSQNAQIPRATALVRSAVSFSQAIREDRLPLDEMRGVPQCMNQYWWLFGVARVPSDDGGRIRMDADARHIIVMCRGLMYFLDVMEEGTNRILDAEELSKALKSILGDARNVPVENASSKTVGLLTTENQKTWSRCRTRLVHEGLRNGRNFALVDSSLFVLCLDDNSPEGPEEVCRNMICGTNDTEKGVQVGTCLNRWYDKLAIIVCRNGAAGMNFEHTCTDGSVDIGMACEIYKGSIKQTGKSANAEDAHLQNGIVPLTNGNNKVSISPTKARKLDWDVPVEITTALQTANDRLVQRIKQHQLSTLDFHHYGSTFIKSSRFSPDAFFQMVLQAAYRTLHPQLVSGFEPVLMRQYLHGRTDVARITTPEAAASAQVFSDERASAPEKIEAMRKAAEAHVRLFKECARGGSHHRHLYVLQQMWKRKQALLIHPRGGEAKADSADESDTIFTDPGWGKLGTTVLMGSNIENPYLAYAGFGPPSAEGFTVVYAIRSDHIALTVCSRNGEAGRLSEAIEKTFMDVKNMIDGVSRA